MSDPTNISGFSIGDLKLTLRQAKELLEDRVVALNTEVEGLKRQLFLESQGKKFITICHYCKKTATKVICVCDKHSHTVTTLKGE